MTNKALLRLDGRDAAHTALVCRALASETRLLLLQQLVRGPVGVTDLAARLAVPLSTVSGHLRLLEEAGLVSVTPLPGSRGGKKLCNAVVQQVAVDIISQMPDAQFSGCLFSQDMPVGNYFDFEVTAPCGLASAASFLAADDDPAGFAQPNHVGAEILWFTTGYLEYRFEIKNNGAEPSAVDRVEFSLEICAEAYGYNESWRSDVGVWANGHRLGTMVCRGDHGGRPGKLNPAWWPAYATQFGDLHTITLTGQGCAVDGKWAQAPTLGSLLAAGGELRLKIGVEKASAYPGGLNLFGAGFGDHAQGILMRVFGKQEATGMA